MKSRTAPSRYARGRDYFMDVRFSGLPAWALASLSAGALVLLIVYHRYLRRVKFSPAALPLILRALSMAAVIVLVSNPTVFYNSSRPVPRRVAILADASQSMALTDPDKKGTRFERALSAADKLGAGLKYPRNWTFVFSDKAAALPPAELKKIKPLGKSTYLFSSLRGTDTGEGLPLTDIVVFSDGRDTSGASRPVASALPRVHAVGIGRGGPDVNVSMGDIQLPDYGFVNKPLNISGEVRTVGLAPGAEVFVEVSRQGRRLAASKVISKNTALSGYRFSLSFTPAETGMYILDVRARSAAHEDVTEDNARTVFVEVISGKRKILLVDAPRWEFAFLNRYLSSLEKVEMRTLLLTAKGGAGTERRAVLGSTASLSEYTLIIAGDIGRASTGAERAALLQYLRGGGSMVLLGGDGSLFDAADSAWGSLIRRSRRDAPAGEGPEAFAPKLTAAGRDSQLLRLVPDAAANADLWSNLPYLYTFNPVDVPPGAEVLAEHPWTNCGSRKCPLIISARENRGRALLMPMDGMWRWKLVRKPTENYDRLWGNVVSALLEPEDTRPIVVTLPKRNFILGADVCFEANVAPALTGASAPIAAINFLAGAQAANITMTKQKLSGSFYSACFTPDKTAVYTVVAHAGGEKSAAEPFAVEPSRDELLLTSINKELLNSISKDTGGMYVDEKQLDSLIDALNKTGAWQTVRSQAELQRPPWCYYVLGLIMVLLSLEWIVRRRGGLT